VKVKLSCDEIQFIETTIVSLVAIADLPPDTVTFAKRLYDKLDQLQPCTVYPTVKLKQP
jgi:hypothetical protein